MAKYYTTCKELPLKNFLNVIEEKNFKWLVKTKDYDFDLKEDLTDLWETILHEYAEIGGDKSSLDLFNVFKELNQLIATYKIINWMIFVLYHRYNKQYIDDLKLFGLNVEIKYNVIQVKSLNKCKQQSRAMLNEIEALRKKINPNEEGIQSNNLYYEAMAGLIKEFGDINDCITVAKYVALRKMLKKINGRDKRRSDI